MTNALQEAPLLPDLPICDPHHHLWALDAYPRYLLDEFSADIAASGHRIVSTVVVDSHAFYSPRRPPGFEFVAETEAMAGMAAMAESGAFGPTRICAGIIGRADLQMGSAVARVLEDHLAAGASRFRGIRAAAAHHPAIVNAHTNAPAGLYSSSSYRDGFAQLARHGLSFEAWQYHTQLLELAALAAAFPDIPIMLNHTGGPLGIGPFAGRREEVFQVWRAGIAEVARRPNVRAKLGGLGMVICGFGFHKRDEPPNSEELAEAWRPYIETCIEAFGPERCCFESNFPPDKQSCSYAVLWNAFKRIADPCSDSEKAMLFHDNAASFYRLDQSDGARSGNASTRHPGAPPTMRPL
jgi:L-fuconolactonase